MALAIYLKSYEPEHPTISNVKSSIANIKEKTTITGWLANYIHGRSKFTRTLKEEILDVTRDKDSIFFMKSEESNFISATYNSKELEQKEQIAACGFFNNTLPPTPNV